MARKKSKGYKGKNWYRSHSFALQVGSSRTGRRRTNKYRRSPTYWVSHENDKVFSKVILRDIEKLWLEINTPTAQIEFKEVYKPEQYPRYRQGLWDGKAFFVTFENSKDASNFKVAMWNFRS